MKPKSNARSSLRWTIERTRALALVVAGTAVVTLAGCGGDSPTGTKAPTTPAGSYNIATINAKALPVAVFADSGYMFEVTAGSMTLTADGKYTAIETFRQTVPGNVSVFVDTTRGTWAFAGTSVTFTNTSDIPPSTFQATWSNSGTLTLSELDFKTTNTFVYSLAR